ncbi:unnamed protein product [Cuscuta epithymum]|uniref:Agenet domain-containing protein n=1 Tax=Cuscuta epithymum TaxID=186058 RepID=A0AAV0CL80_9ASTE|nr:unnamed protein product [Cuscuta epithymum]
MDGRRALVSIPMGDNFEEILNTYFTNGAEVEISSNDDGFRGAWYEGKVIRAVSKKVRKTQSKKEKRVEVVVEYETLMADEAGKVPLQETVDIVQVRPRQPREGLRRFKSSEEVDAFYNDGWWEGIVIAALEGGKYSVFFRATREQLDFAGSDLRLHREWANGEWIPRLGDGDAEENKISKEEKPDNDISQQTFHQGMMVEVSSDEEGYDGAWFVATVVKQLDSGNYMVEYQSLRNDDDTAFVQEEVDHMHIRPCPPDTGRVKSFKVFDRVDALYNDGWWVGTIYKVLRGNNKYIVYFSNTKEELTFKQADLRQHQDWVNRKWKKAPKDKKLPSSSSNKSKG